MKEASKKFKTVAEYFSSAPAEARSRLKEIRAIVTQAAPKAEEVISYNMPGLRLHDMLVWYAGYKKHIGFYPRSSMIDKFQKELAAYEVSKGAIRFPLDEPLPAKLITKIVKVRIKENEEKEKLKLKAKRK
jgi:uncharacterized protein YdhG (YjbR/CyaY superfamily)